MGVGCVGGWADMKRSRPRRSTTPIKRTARLPRSTTKIRARKADPSKRRWARHRDPEWCAKIREHDCVLSGRGVTIRPAEVFCEGHTECAHVRPRSVGGDDRGNTVPLCRRHHRQQHAIGMPAFEKLYFVDLIGTAREYELSYPEFGAHPGWEDGAQ